MNNSLKKIIKSLSSEDLKTLLKLAKLVRELPLDEESSSGEKRNCLPRDENGFYYCEKHSWERREACPNCDHKWVSNQSFCNPYGMMCSRCEIECICFVGGAQNCPAHASWKPCLDQRVGADAQPPAADLSPLAARIAKSRAKYPDGPSWQSLWDEFGEVGRALNKREGRERVDDELLDVACVAMRLYFGDYGESIRNSYGSAGVPANKQPPAAEPAKDGGERGVPTDAAVVIREQFRPDTAAARETIEATEHLLADLRQPTPAPAEQAGAEWNIDNEVDELDAIVFTAEFSRDRNLAPISLALRRAHAAGVAEVAARAMKFLDDWKCGKTTWAVFERDLRALAAGGRERGE